MFYSELTALLRSTANIANTVTVHNGQPAIFANEAPEEAEMPYIVFRIETSPLPDKVISTSNLYIDYHDYNNSRVTADEAAIAIEDLLEHNKIKTDQLTDIRFSLLNTGYIPGGDPRTIHHNSTFSCRAARYGWMNRNK
jgi:hypothetical protein